MNKNNNITGKMDDCKTRNQGRPAYIGQGLKFALEITSPGFSMEDDDFEVEIMNRMTGKSLKIAKTDMLVQDDGTFVLAFKSGDLGIGELVLTTTAYVPDTDFEDGIRVEIDKKLLCKVE